jgi:hypothetical protein
MLQTNSFSLWTAQYMPQFKNQKYFRDLHFEQNPNVFLGLISAVVSFMSLPQPRDRRLTQLTTFLISTSSSHDFSFVKTEKLRASARL